MTEEGTGVNAKDAEAIAAYDAALRDFSIELNRLHIAYGAPSYAVIVKASVRPKLTKAGINEALSGKRLPSIDSLMEFVRVVSNPLPPPTDTPAPRCQPELAEAWRARWQKAKFAQRQAQAPWRRLRDTVSETLKEARREAEAIRAAAREEVDRIVKDACREATAIRAVARAEADRIVADARLTVGDIGWERDRALSEAELKTMLREAFLGTPAEPSAASGTTPQQAMGEAATPEVDEGAAGPTVVQATSVALNTTIQNPFDVDLWRLWTFDLAALRAGLARRRSREQ